MFHSLPPDVELTQTAAVEELERRLMNDIRDIERKLQERGRIKSPVEELAVSMRLSGSLHNEPPAVEQPDIQRVFTEEFTAEALKRTPQIDVHRLGDLLTQAEEALVSNKIHTCAEHIMTFIAEHTQQATEVEDLYRNMVEELSELTLTAVDTPCSNLQHEISAMETEMEKNSASCEAAGRARQELLDQIESLTNTLAGKETALATKESHCEALSSELEELLNHNVQLQMNLQGLEESVRGASAETELIRKLAQGKYGDGEAEFLFQQVKDLIETRDKLTREIDRCRVYLRRMQV
ncbi:hypothetical protein QR46_0984 [Giardia duodenalis assemblage B]|uniref:Uncharacterized protein n=1 Tax=Giardia duodenalis assemblage B TaxID=1394984 RepID=A0A132NY59_GIAIN|nr:hypothetical protein QR46_0984 [Giardia intestinalis assemblage B]